MGTFSTPGTFDGVIPRWPRLAELGITAIEIMPVATFAGNHGWGYDGVYISAPHPAYGGPDGLKRLVDAAHEHGIGVILDVVYNHMGAGSDAVTAFGPYLTDRAQTIWGEAIDYSQRPVREWAIQNAEMWIRDYGVDGLRLDAVHSIVDDSPTARHGRAGRSGSRRSTRVRCSSTRWRSAICARSANGVTTPSGRTLCTTPLHVLLTGEREGYYAQYGTLADLGAS